MIGDKWDELFWDGLRLESSVGGAWFLAYFCLLNNETFYTSPTYLALLYTTGTASGGLQYWVQGVGYLPWGHTRVPMRKTPWDICFKPNGIFLPTMFFLTVKFWCYRGFDFRFVFITITPRPASNGDKHKILVLNIGGIWLGLQNSKIKVRQFQEVMLP